MLDSLHLSHNSVRVSALAEGAYPPSTWEWTPVISGPRSRIRECPRWRRRFFVAITALTADAAEYFNQPPDRTVIMGPRIPL